MLVWNNLAKINFFNSIKRRAQGILAAAFLLVVSSGCGESEPAQPLKENVMSNTAPFGTWESPVSAQLVSSSSNAVVGLHVDGEQLYWLEARPTEGGRIVLMRANEDGSGTAITGDEAYIRTLVHEYGGVSSVVHDGKVYYANVSDQALYAQTTEPGQNAAVLSGVEGMRYADCVIDSTHNRLICVGEDHSGEGEAVNFVTAVSLEGESNAPVVLWQGSDFVAYPRISPDGSQLSWVAWDHPNMPWDNTALWLAEVREDGSLSNARRINQGVDESVLQPTWDNQGNLFVLTDRSGWWNLYQVDQDQLSAVHEIRAELGGPLWGLGTQFYVLDNRGRALIEPGNAQGNQLGWLDLESGEFSALDLPYTGYAGFRSTPSSIYMLAGRKDGPDVILKLDIETSAVSVVRENGSPLLEPEQISKAQPITFPSANDTVAYAYYYPPTNPNYTAPAGETPPLLVLMHGGPTAATSSSFNIAKQYWTSRGIAVVDVNYRGSTGYGREYRQALNGMWGVVDLEDAVAVTRYLVGQGLADPNRLLIRGGSAGGYTTLSALAFTEEFAAGANYFGVSDLSALAEHTHKFESRYLDSMIGPYPEAKEVYEARSPINALDGFSAPLITFQGLEDKVVPPAQSEAIYEALKEKGTPTAYIPFEGEQHGFRKAENNITALESELYFYGKVLGFTPAGDLPEVEIDNLSH
ncbi:MAG: prolyl oligopeptidase family serine peptidase [Pseudomonadota bacterium]